MGIIDLYAKVIGDLTIRLNTALYSRSYWHSGRGPWNIDPSREVQSFVLRLLKVQ